LLGLLVHGHDYTLGSSKAFMARSTTPARLWLVTSDLLGRVLCGRIVCP
jgi:hypothetical protein